MISVIAAAVLVMKSFALNVETDRQWYLAGETMTVGVTDADGRVAYAELCDTRGLAAGAVVGLRGGKGEAAVVLPATLHSGYYVLSVYTRSDSRAEQRLVAVVNPLRRSVDDDIRWVKGDSCRAVGEGTADLVSAKSADSSETEGHFVKVRVGSQHGGQRFGADEIRPTLGIVGKQIHYFEGLMVNDSTAVFRTFGIHGRQPMVLSALSTTGVSLPVTMVSPFAALLPKRLPHLVFHYERSEVEARSLAMQRQQMARQKPGEASDEAVADVVPMTYDATLFGSQPAISYNLDEYRPFLTVREVLIEYVTSVERRRVGANTQLAVLREQKSDGSMLPALVLIDGVPVADTAQLLAYDARRIHYINIYDGRYTFGRGVYDGIISFVTRTGQLTNFPTDSNAQYLVYDFP